MKKLFLISFMAVACSMGGKSVIVRQDSKQIWHPCEDYELEDKDPVGKFCISICKDYRGSDDISKQNECKKDAWETRVRDFTDPVQFKKARDEGMRLIQESEI